ncbi:MAG TPA: sn-glycerol-3-phosphate ABC transporter ATP-binding protein UgpC [Opitutaceae bacterium]
MAQVEISRLVKTYPDRTGPGARAVDGINLTIFDREFMVLVGPSGCGKSTTLRMIAGLEDISDGSIAIDGKIVNQVAPKDRDIAMVFQNYALYPHMSVYENMAFGLKLRNVPKAEIDTRVREAAALLGLETYLDRKPKALSGGQRQRVAVGRAIVRRPKVFLFDEPLSNLDAKMRVGMRAEISRLHQRLGATMIYVTHDQVEAMTMGNRICVMKDGRILQVAAPLELYNRPADLFVAGFIGSPPMNLFTGTLASEGDTVRFVESSSTAAVTVPLPASLAAAAAAHGAREVVLGIRPEDVQLVAPGANAHAEATVDVVEPMGAETYLTLKTGNGSLIARVHPGEPATRGQAVRVAFAPDKLHLFDRATERAIRS